jgi:four helix bundle protein
MTPQELRERLTVFAVDCVELCGELGRHPQGRRLADQLFDSATSTAANYRAASRARSRREFLAKLGIALEEADETVGWLEIAVRSKIATKERMAALQREADEVLAILAASRRTADQNERKRRDGP